MPARRRLLKALVVTVLTAACSTPPPGDRDALLGADASNDAVAVLDGSAEARDSGATDASAGPFVMPDLRCLELPCSTNADCAECGQGLVCANQTCALSCEDQRAYVGNLTVGDAQYPAGGPGWMPPTSDVPRLDLVTGVTMFQGDLEVIGTSLTDLRALACLQHITGTLQIGGVSACTVFTGQPYCIEEGNRELSSLTGLERLEAIGGDLVIRNNPRLESLSGLQALTNVGGTLQVTDNGSLPSCDVTKLEEQVGVACVGTCVEPDAGMPCPCTGNASTCP